MKNQPVKKNADSLLLSPHPVHTLSIIPQINAPALGEGSVYDEMVEETGQAVKPNRSLSGRIRLNRDENDGRDFIL